VQRDGSDSGKLDKLHISGIAISTTSVSTVVAASLTANGGSTLHMAAINKKVIAVVGATGQQGGA
jgi:hypothetical protein